ncbi:MAG: hypothetical protein CM15mP53_00220 [Ectothiorhodospiraceae bacterium]|nr:MAG: hypothetical protein CM15mP53_00220 [Ectothiorhodospiraceae bacterium]
MDIEKYISNKKNVRVLKLVDDGDLLKELDSCTYESIDSLDNYKKNVFSDDELVVIITDLESLTNSDFFKKNYGLQNIMLLITNDDKFKKNTTKYLNMFFGYGYKYFGPSNNNKVQVFIYDISDYKDNPDWLNNKNWANPELWEK